MRRYDKFRRQNCLHCWVRVLVLGGGSTAVPWSVSASCAGYDAIRLIAHVQHCRALFLSNWGIPPLMSRRWKQRSCLMQPCAAVKVAIQTRGFRVTWQVQAYLFLLTHLVHKKYTLCFLQGYPASPRIFNAVSTYTGRFLSSDTLNLCNFII